MGNIYRLSELYQSIEYNKENQIYDIFAELQAKDKKIILCKVPAQKFLGWLETPSGKGSGKTVIANYTISNHALKSAHNSFRQYKG